MLNDFDLAKVCSYDLEVSVAPSVEALCPTEELTLRRVLSHQDVVLM